MTSRPTIVLASGNQGKIREISTVLASSGLAVVSQSDYKTSEVPETGLSFVENALIKARHASQHTGLATIADDSGLEVDVLNGAPGIYSSRYAGTHATNQQNVEKLLVALQGVDEAERIARFQCVIVYLRHAKDPTPIICSGTWEGRILDTSRGHNGFGYDPVFYVPTHQCTAAELSPEIKNTLSHRAQALLQLKLYFHKHSQA